jgi:hypothetical protein
MIRISSILRGEDPGLFELFERAGTNIHDAAGLLSEMLGNFPDSAHLAGESVTGSTTAISSPTSWSTG